jgi:FKBP-type peptidyl-prolyl cis-trans isomerase
MNQKGNISVIVSFVVVVAIIGLVVYLLMHKPEGTNPLQGIDTSGTIGTPSDKTPTQSTPQSQEQQSTSAKPMDSTRKLENFTPVAHVEALQKIDLKVGTGAEVKPGDTVSVQYTGAIAATGAVFQSSKDFGSDPVTFPLAGVIKGWTDGIPGMKVGGIRRLVIPSAQAYGANPRPDSGIPPNADLVFDVELVGIK